MLSKFKNDKEGYFKANETRIENINKNKHSETFNETVKQMFAVNDINKLKQMLEDVYFYESIPKWAIKKFYDCIQQKKLTAEDFINEYNISAENGFVGVCIMLGVL